jgi:predicted MPP superfamily phosphohydrolase
MFEFLKDFKPVYENQDRLNLLDQRRDKFFIAYRKATDHPWGIVIPFLIGSFISAISWFLSGFFVEQNFYRYLFSNLIFIPINLILLTIFGIILRHASPFWLIGPVFYGLQIYLPIFLLIKLSFSDFWLNYLDITLFVLVFLVLTISLYAFLIAPFRLKKTFYTIESPISNSFRIVHLTDLQTDYFGKREKKLIEIVNQLSPDVVLYSGDYFNGSAKTNKRGFDSARKILTFIKAKKAIFAVSSDSNNLEDHAHLFANTEIHYLQNSIHKLQLGEQSILFCGICRRYPNWQNLIAETEYEKDYKIMISHGPEIFFEPEIEKIHPNLIFCGHTHGGQVNLPLIGPLTSGTKHGRKLASGWFTREKIKMYVNRGIGMDGWFGPKVRFFCPPEILVIDFEK